MFKFPATKILSAQEELEYLKLAAAGNLAARNKLIVANIPFIIKCARSFPGYNQEIEGDLITAGSLGLMRAIEKYDFTMGTRLLTIGKFYINSFMQKSVGSRRKKLSLLSLDATYNSDGDQDSFVANLADTSNLSLDEECENNIKKEKLMAAINTLKPNEQEVLILHYGLNNQKAHTFEEIGAIKGRTRSRMQQIEQNALKHLRQNQNIQQLAS